MIITVEKLHELDACYVDDDAADDEQRAAVARLPAHIADIATWEDIPLSDVVWLTSRVAPDVTRCWALWCAGRALRHWKKEFPTDTTIRDLLRMTARFLRGKATQEELDDARAAARAVYSASVYSASASAYAYAYAYAYARAATDERDADAWYTERTRQRARLVLMLRRLPAPRAP